MSFGLFVFVTTQAARVETNTNQTNLPNIDKALKQKSRRLKIRVIRIIRVRKTTSSSWLKSSNLLSTKIRLQL